MWLPFRWKEGLGHQFGREDYSRSFRHLRDSFMAISTTSKLSGSAYHSRIKVAIDNPESWTCTMHVCTPQGLCSPLRALSSISSVRIFVLPFSFLCFLVLAVRAFFPSFYTYREAPIYVSSCDALEAYAIYSRNLAVTSPQPPRMPILLY